MASVIGDVVAGAIQGTTNTAFALRDVWERRHARRREDNAVQRRMADMRAAGINPILAAGQPAASMSPTATHQPDTGQSVLDAMMLGQELRRAKEETENLRAERELIQANAERVKSETIRNRLEQKYEGFRLTMGAQDLDIRKQQEARTQQMFEHNLNILMNESKQSDIETRIRRQEEILGDLRITSQRLENAYNNIRNYYQEYGIRLDLEDARVRAGINEVLLASDIRDLLLISETNMTTDQFTGSVSSILIAMLQQALHRAGVPIRSFAPGNIFSGTPDLPPATDAPPPTHGGPQTFGPLDPRRNRDIHARRDYYDYYGFDPALLDVIELRR